MLTHAQDQLKDLIAADLTRARSAPYNSIRQAPQRPAWTSAAPIPLSDRILSYSVTRSPLKHTPIALPA